MFFTISFFLPTNCYAARRTEHQSVQSEVQSKQHSEERPRHNSTDSNTKNEPEVCTVLESQSAGRERLSSTASNPKNDADGHLALESKQPHSVESPRLVSKESDMQIESEGHPHPASESKQPHPTDKSEQDGYLASESSESPDSEERKVQPKRKNNRKEKHLARPQSPISSTDSDGNDSREGQLKVTPATAGEPAPSMHVPINQVGPKHSIELHSGNEIRSSSDGDYIEPHQEQNKQVQVSISMHTHAFNFNIIFFPSNRVYASILVLICTWILNL